MAPVFPHGYAHSRRVACDQMYGGGVEYTLNSLGGGWWLNKLYLLDPDLVVFGAEWPYPGNLISIFSIYIYLSSHACFL